MRHEQWLYFKSAIDPKWCDDFVQYCTESYEPVESTIGFNKLPEEYSEKGTVLIFPSFYKHQVQPVTSGTRHSLVTWVEGPHWR